MKTSRTMWAVGWLGTAMVLLACSANDEAAEPEVDGRGWNGSDSKTVTTALDNPCAPVASSGTIFDCLAFKEQCPGQLETDHCKNLEAAGTPDPCAPVASSGTIFDCLAFEERCPGQPVSAFCEKYELDASVTVIQRVE